MYKCCQVTLIFTADGVMKMEKTDIILCKLDVNVKNRIAVAGSVGFFELE